MTRDELLDKLRRELTSEEWNELRPDERLVAVEARIDALVEKVSELRREYDDTSAADLLGALDDLAASVSYLKSDVGQLFSDTTRLADEIRATLRRADRGETPEQMMFSGTAEEESEGGDSERSEAPEQRQLFDR